VGRTCQTLRQRMSGHRTNITNLGHNYIYRHFNSDSHSLEDFVVQIIEHVPQLPNDHTLADRELYWQKELCTIYPFGLKDNVRGVGNMSDPRNDTTNVSNLFNSQLRNGRSHGHRTSSIASKHYHITIDSLITKCKAGHCLHSIRSDIFSLPERSLNALHEKSREMQWNKTIPVELGTKSSVT
jgi:hypothetical protein